MTLNEKQIEMQLNAFKQKRHGRIRLKKENEIKCDSTTRSDMVKGDVCIYKYETIQNMPDAYIKWREDRGRMKRKVSKV